jgi:hypothetical protein
MSNEDYLAHYGILGQKWGRRRYQNPDGTLTPLGRERLYGESGKKKVVSGLLNNGGRYIARLDKNKLKRMMSAADAKRRLDNYDWRISSRKAKGKDTSKLEEKRRKVVVNKDLYSKGLTKGEIEIGRSELRKRDEKIGRIASIPISAAVGIGLGAVNKYLPMLLSGAISHTTSHYRISPEMAMIQDQVKRNPIMDAFYAPTGRDYLMEDIIKENILKENHLH